MREVLAEIRSQLPLLCKEVWLHDWEHFLSSPRADVRLPAVRPDADRLVADLDASPGEQLFDVPMAQVPALARWLGACADGIG